MAKEVTEVSGLPPRKRYKVMEQQRRRQEEEEESPARGVHSPCRNVTNIAMSLNANGLQEFSKSEKQKSKLEQQENRLPVTLPPLPPRPVAVKRKGFAPSLPLSAPPPIRLKLQGEKFYSRAFKTWGTPSPIHDIKHSQLPGHTRSSAEASEDLEFGTNQHQRHVEHAKAWTLAKGTTCSTNKAQADDIEMMVCEPVPVSSASICDSETHARTLQSAPTVAMDRTAQASNSGSVVVARDDHKEGAAEIAADDAMGDVLHKVSILEVEGKESDLASGEIVTSDLGSVVSLDDTTGSHSVFEHSRTLLDVVMMSEEGKKGKTAIKVQDSEKAISLVHASNGIQRVSESCASQCTDPPTLVVALAESKTSEETSIMSEEPEEMPLVVEDKTHVRNIDYTVCSSGEKHRESAARSDANASVGIVEDEVLEDKPVVASTSSDSLGELDVQETNTKRDSLIAKIDEQAEIAIFERMFEREGYPMEHDEIADSLSQFFLAFSGDIDVDSQVIDMEVDVGLAVKSEDVGNASSAPIFDSENPSEEHQNNLGNLNSIVMVGEQDMPLGKMPDISQVQEDSMSSEDEGIDFQVEKRCGKLESECKSSKEDSCDWDLEMEVPNFDFGIRSGMRHRVKAPDLHLKSSGADDSKFPDEEEDEEDDNGGCDICRNPDADPSDPIVYCDGCDIPVHADCYGNPLSHGIPEGDWFCNQCQHRKSTSRSCSLCPRTGGAMKMTTEGNWAHLSCAVFVPEVFFRKADDLEGIDTSHVPSKRWLSTCCVCKSNGGACVDCTEIGCKASFHVSCALKKDLALEFRNGRNGAIVISFCPEHTAAWDEQQEARKAGRSKYKIVSREPQKSKASDRSKLR